VNLPARTWLALDFESPVASTTAAEMPVRGEGAVALRKRKATSVTQRRSISREEVTPIE
jgi:hypothetical protein